MAVEPEVEEGGVALATLLEALGQVSDPRKARGVRYPQGAMLGLCILAFICGRMTLTGVWRFGRDNKRLLKELGFTRMTSPSVPTLSRMLCSVDPRELQQALAGWLSGLIASARLRRPAKVASVDGKAVRSSGAHVLNVFIHEVERVAWAAPVEGKANEITAFKALLADLFARYPFLELVVGDAMFAGRPLCEQLIENGRHYLFQIKADQRALLEKMNLLFSPKIHAAPKKTGRVEKKGVTR